MPEKRYKTPRFKTDAESDAYDCGYSSALASVSDSLTEFAEHISCVSQELGDPREEDTSFSDRIKLFKEAFVKDVEKKETQENTNVQDQ
jgi:hypothetical protein